VVDEIVYLINDSKSERQWHITGIDNKQIVITTDDVDRLNINDIVKVVSSNEIYRPQKRIYFSNWNISILNISISIYIYTCIYIAMVSPTIENEINALLILSTQKLKQDQNNKEFYTSAFQSILAEIYNIKDHRGSMSGGANLKQLFVQLLVLVMTFKTSMSSSGWTINVALLYDKYCFAAAESRILLLIEDIKYF
jgi:hypothetical protein